MFLLRMIYKVPAELPEGQYSLFTEDYIKKLEQSIKDNTYKVKVAFKVMRDYGDAVAFEEYIKANNPYCKIALYDCDILHIKTPDTEFNKDLDIDMAWYAESLL